jgi:CxxC-x17-CxxC domain-containing protein
LLTHRVGRTGRMGRAGRAITLLTGEDSAKWRQLERGLGFRIARQAWRGGKTYPAPVQAPATARPVVREEVRAATHRPSASPRLRPAWQGAQVVHEASTDAPRERTNAFAPRRPNQPMRAPRPSAPASAPVNRESRPAASASSPVSVKGERHEIVCSGCGKPSTIGFEPDYSRPIYCNACHKVRQASRTGGSGRGYRGGQATAERS